MTPVKLVLIGGFLGAGKTTLLAATARRLAEKGLRVGVITNDQAEELVDTQNLSFQGLGVQEVAGGCFCCRFKDLVGAAGRLVLKSRPEIILAEPVGSCTDLSATVLQPIKDLYGKYFKPAPYGVLADVERLADLFSGRAKDLFPDNVLYIYTKQLEEADLIVLNKTDLLTGDELQKLRDQVSRTFPNNAILPVSAQTGEGMDQWLEWIMSDRPAGRNIAQVDYDTYAEGEAALGWLNAKADLLAPGGADWPALVQRLMETLRDRLRARNAEIAHLKLFLAATGGALVSSLTSAAGEPTLLTHGSIETTAKNAELVLNARVHLDPEILREEIERALRKLDTFGVEIRFQKMEAFRPSRPQPTHRYTRTID